MAVVPFVNDKCVFVYRCCVSYVKSHCVFHITDEKRDIVQHRINGNNIAIIRKTNFH